MPPRRRSKLAGGGYGEPTHQDTPPLADEEPAEAVDQHEQNQHDDHTPDEDEQPEPRPRLGKGVAGPPVTRNPRRLRVVGKVTDDDLVSFNCKMSRGLRREVRHFAADAECDIQDVVAAALAEYLVARGRHVPASEVRQPG
jgi:hypothetical protein